MKRNYSAVANWVQDVYEPTYRRRRNNPSYDFDLDALEHASTNSELTTANGDVGLSDAQAPLECPEHLDIDSSHSKFLTKPFTRSWARRVYASQEFNGT
jgi:hypothetical protein